MDDLKCISAKDLSVLTGLGLQSIRQAVTDDSRKLKLPKVTRLGSSIRFRMDHVREWLDEQAGVTLTQTSSPVQPTLLATPRPGRPRKVARELVGAA